MKPKDLKMFAKEVAKKLKTEQALSNFSRMLKKVTIEAALNAELDDHLGYDKHELSRNSNSRNGYSDKTLYTDDGRVDIEVPRDRDSLFEPQLVKKQQTRLVGLYR